MGCAFRKSQPRQLQLQPVPCREIVVDVVDDNAGHAGGSKLKADSIIAKEFDGHMHEHRQRTSGASAAGRGRTAADELEANASSSASNRRQRAVVIHGIPLQLGDDPSSASILARLQSAAPPAPSLPVAARPAADAAARGRTLRIFVSSTFQDMMMERDEIRAAVHPRLRALCAARGLFLHIGDLRWGIRDDEVASGEVVRLCLREVQRSQYFVGLLKGRYGWHINPNAPEDDESNALFRWNLRVAADEFPWVNEVANRSVTEIEMRAGSLRDLQAARGKALFFFAEAAQPDEREGLHAVRMMGELKDEIRRSGLPVQLYRDPQQLSAVMSEALVKMVERDFPVDREQTWLQTQRAAQAAFAGVRQRTFAGDPEDFAALNQYAEGNSEEIFVLFGEGGSGKSSLLANWTAQWSAMHPSELTIVHFVGGSQSSSTLPSIARRLGEEVKERWPEVEELEWRGDDVTLAGQVRAWLTAGAQRWPARVLLALDGLDQLQGPTVVQSLAWLPDAAGSRLRIVASCIPGRALDTVKQLPRLTTRELLPLDVKRREHLVQRLLHEQGRSLSDDRVNRIVQSAACGNPLYLRTLLEELSAVAVHATLDAVLDECLVCSGPRDLFRAVLRRLVARHKLKGGAGGESPVAEVARAILCSRHGMAESELVELLRVGNSSGVTEVAWQLLWYDLLTLLIDRDGVFGFFHRCAAEAAQLEFGLSREDSSGALEDLRENGEITFHLLGNFFAKQEPSKRRAEEGSWALAHAGPAASDQLANFLTCSDVLRYLDSSEVCELWLQSGRSDEASIRYENGLELYGASGPLESAGPDGKFGDPKAVYLSRAGWVLHTIGRSKDGLPFLTRAIDICEKTLGPEHPVTGAIINQLASLHKAMANYEAALPLFERSLAISERALGSEHKFTAKMLHELASLHLARLDHNAALLMYERALAIREKALGPDDPGTAATLHDMAILHQMRGNYTTAMQLCERDLAIKEKALGPEHPHTASTLHNLAALHVTRGQYAAALPLFERALAIREKSEGPEHPNTAATASDLGQLHRYMGNHAKAFELYERALAIREKVLGSDHPQTASTASDLGRLYQDQCNYAAALPIFKRALAIREKVFGLENAFTAAALHDLAMLHRAQRENKTAIELYERALAIFERTLGPDHARTAGTLHELAQLHLSCGNFKHALPLYERALAIKEKALGAEHVNVAATLNDLAHVRLELGDRDAALSLFERALAIKEKSLGPEHADTAATLLGLARLHHAQGNTAAELPLYERALVIFEKALGPKHSSTATTLHRLGRLHLDLGNHSAARPLLERALMAREELLGHSHPDTAETHDALGRLESACGRREAARPHLQRAFSVKEKALGPDHPSTVSTMSELAQLHQAEGNFAAAVPLCERALATIEKAMGKDHPSARATLHQLASLHLAQGNYDAALPLYQRALAICEKGFGPEHANTGVMLHELASLHLERRDYSAALPLYERALSILEKSLGPDHLHTAAAMRWFGRLHMERGDLPAARSMLERSLAIRRAGLGEGHTATAASATALAELRMAEGEHGAARSLLEGALAAREAAVGPAHLDTAETLHAFGRLEAACGRPDAARARLEAALAVRRERLGEMHPLAQETAAELTALRTY